MTSPLPSQPDASPGRDAPPSAEPEPGAIRRAPGEARAALGGAAAALAGFATTGLLVAVSIQRFDPLSGGALAAGHAALAALHLVGLGAVPCAAVALSGRAARGRLVGRRALLAAVAAGTLVASSILPADVERFAARLTAWVPAWLTVAAFCVAAGVGLAGSIALGRPLRRPRGRALAVALAAAGVFLEPGIFAGLYPAFHFFLLAFVATFLGSALVGARVPSGLARGWRGPLACAATGALGLASYALPVGDALYYRVVRDGDVVVPFTGRLVEAADSARPGVARSPWLRDRSRVPPTPPTPGARRPERPFVLLITIDSMRYDVLEGKHAHRAALPNLRRLAREGVSFRRAHAPGSSTAYSLTALFASKYYSQMEWHDGGGWWKMFPRHDPTPRFPALLSEAGVWTAVASCFYWLSNAEGVTRGFEVFDFEDIPGGRWRKGEGVTDALVRRIREVGDRPAFLYAHYVDAHDPYTRGGRTGPLVDRYARELELVDGFLGRALAAIEEDPALRERALVVVTSDHGDAFGEHRRRFHGNSLYEELLHVPLVFWSPRLSPREVDTYVGLVDVGPTILDVFGLPTPGESMGESLLPALLGRRFAPTRPLVAPRGHLRSLVTPEGRKIIRDARTGTLEVYDLTTDPGEQRNLVGAMDPAAREAVDFLDAFFRVHQYARPGYVEPFRRL